MTNGAPSKIRNAAVIAKAATLAASILKTAK